MSTTGGRVALASRPGIAPTGGLVVAFVLRAAQMGMLAIVAAYLLDRQVPIQLVGLVLVASAAGAALASIVTGRLVDGVGAWPMLVAGCLCGATGMLVFATGQHWLLLTAANFLTAIGVSTAGTALRTSIAVSVAADQHERAFGRLTSAATAGAIAGPVSVGVLVVAGTALAPWFAVVALTVAAGVAVAARRPPAAPAPAPAPAVPTDDADGAPDATVASWGEVVRRVAPITALVTTTSTMYGVYAVAWAVYLRGIGASDSVVAWSFAATFVPIVLLSGRVERILPTVPRWLVVGAATVALGALAFVYAGVTQLWLALVVSVIEGLLLAVSMPLTYALIAKVTPPGGSGRAFGLAGAADSISAGIGTAIAGTLIALGGVAMSFQIAGAYCVIGTVVALGWWRRHDLPLRRATPTAAPAPGAG